jgi:predicted cupin superfamily sugar epimerase
MSNISKRSSHRLISLQTYHILHQGRAEYTLITPGNPPVIEKKVMGTNVRVGEQRQLLVGTGVWKMSRIPPEDLKAPTTQDEKDRTGCLITEVVTPGFHWEDHKFLTLEELKELFKDVEDGKEKMRDIISFVTS